jgi:uncharacterized protein YkwD
MFRSILFFLVCLILAFPVAPAAAQTETGILGQPAFQTDETGPQPNFSGCTRVDVQPFNDATEQEVVYLTNLERQKVGAAPLKRETGLGFAARYHAKDLADDNYFDHPTYDGWGDGIHGVTKRCDTGTRIGLYYPSWRGENIAGGYSSPSAVIAGWMGSTAGHKENMLNTGHREIGAGYYSGGYWGQYWVQDFGTRSAVYPLVINLEAAQTSTHQVSLYVYGEGVFTQMRFKNDGGDWGSWMAFAKNLNWNLNALKGTRSVTVELKKADGTTSTSTDDIYLTTSAPALSVAPGEIFFIYEKSTGLYHPSSVTLQPQNSASTAVLTWTAAAADAWVDLSQPGGLTPNGSTQVSISGLNTSTPGVFTSSITVSVTDPAGTLNSPLVIPVRVAVVTDLNHKVFLPGISR